MPAFRMRMSPREETMAWQPRITNALADVLRFAMRAAIMCNGIMLSIASVYVTAKLCLFTVRYLNRTIFGQPW